MRLKVILLTSLLMIIPVSADEPEIPPVPSKIMETIERFSTLIDQIRDMVPICVLLYQGPAISIAETFSQIENFIHSAINIQGSTSASITIQPIEDDGGSMPGIQIVSHLEGTDCLDH